MTGKNLIKLQQIKPINYHCDGYEEMFQNKEKYLYWYPRTCENSLFWPRLKYLNLYF